MASRGTPELTWQNSVLLQGDAAETVAALKQEDGPELQVHGSANLIQTLMRANLVDAYQLIVFPVLVGTGKRLFGDGTTAAGLKLVDTVVSKKGVVVGNYEPAGELVLGSFVPVARLEHDDRRLGRAAGREGIDVAVPVVRADAVPEPSALLPFRGAGPHTPLAVDQVDPRIRVRREVQPPRGRRVAPAVHRQGDEIGPVLVVAEDDDPLLAGSPADRMKTEHSEPAALGGTREADPTPGDPIEGAMAHPRRADEPAGRQLVCHDLHCRSTP